MVLRESDPAEVGGYRIEDRLGSGGMGVVYRARSASGRRLALKIVHAQYADDDEFRARFRREVAAARRVSGAFTAPVVDADADASRPWMATLWIPGTDLGTHVRDHGPLPRERLRELIAGLAEALRDIHRAGVVHRDLKPANVMLAEDGPRVIDFGISRGTEFGPADALTQTGRVMGTPPFMSPEQFSAPHEVGPAADVFSLGAVVVFAATGRGPFDSPSPYETAVRVVEGNADLDGVPAGILPLVRRCLAKDPADRPTPDEILALLDTLDTLDTLDAPAPGGAVVSPAPARPPLTGAPTVGGGPLGPHGEEPLTRPAVRPRRRRRTAALVLATGVLVAGVGTAAATLMRDGDDPGRLPKGFTAWHARAEDPSPDPEPQPPMAPFNRCVAVVESDSLVCAGDEIAATRFDLADGENTWGVPVDPTADRPVGGSLGGTVIGVRDGRVYAYGADDRPAENEDDLDPVRVYVQALDPATGRVLWRTDTGDGPLAMEPNSDYGAAVEIEQGVLAVSGEQGKRFVLLDGETGERRWERDLPSGGRVCLLRQADGAPYLVCQNGGSDEPSETRVLRVDPETGRTLWTVTLEGDKDLVGQIDGRLVLLDTEDDIGTVTYVNTSSRVITHARLQQVQPEGTRPHLVSGGRLLFVLPNGGVRLFDAGSGRRLWTADSGVDRAGTPLVADGRVYLAGISGRLAVLDLRTGAVLARRAGRDDSAGAEYSDLLAAPVLVGDALYVPYGVRSVYAVDVRTLTD